MKQKEGIKINNQIKQILEKWSASINEKKYRETAQCYEPLTCNALMRQADKPMENEELRERGGAASEPAP